MQLLSVFGVLVMVLAVLVSVAIVALNDQVASVDELPMFAPLMCVGMALIALGMINSMLRSSPSTKRSPVDQPTVARCPFSGATATLPPPRKTKAAEDDSEEDEDAEAPEKRVSRCPFGFG